MPQDLFTLIMERGPAMISAMAENPSAADKFLILVLVMMIFALAWRGRR